MPEVQIASSRALACRHVKGVKVLKQMRTLIQEGVWREVEQQVCGVGAKHEMGAAGSLQDATMQSAVCVCVCSGGVVAVVVVLGFGGIAVLARCYDEVDP